MLGENKINLKLNINGKNYGETIALNLIIMSKKIIEFRKEYNLNKEDYSDKFLFDKRKKFNGNNEAAFPDLFP